MFNSGILKAVFFGSTVLLATGGIALFVWDLLRDKWQQYIVVNVSDATKTGTDEIKDFSCKLTIGDKDVEDEFCQVEQLFFNKSELKEEKAVPTKHINFDAIHANQKTDEEDKVKITEQFLKNAKDNKTAFRVAVSRPFFEKYKVEQAKNAVTIKLSSKAKEKSKNVEIASLTSLFGFTRKDKVLNVPTSAAPTTYLVKFDSPILKTDAADKKSIKATIASNDDFKCSTGEDKAEARKVCTLKAFGTIDESTKKASYTDLTYTKDATVTEFNQFQYYLLTYTTSSDAPKFADIKSDLMFNVYAFKTGTSTAIDGDVIGQKAKFIGAVIEDKVSNSGKIFIGA